MKIWIASAGAGMPQLLSPRSFEVSLAYAATIHKSRGSEFLSARSATLDSCVPESIGNWVAVHVLTGSLPFQLIP